MKCQAIYYTTNLSFPREKHCTNNATCIYNGFHYCGIHDPAKKAERHKISEEKKNANRIRKSNLNIVYLKLKQMRSQNGN